MTAALRAQVESVDERFAWWSITVGRPSGGGWVEVSSLGDDTTITAIYSRMLDIAAGRADVAAVFAAAMTSILVEPLVSSIVIDQRSWSLDRGQHAVRFDPEGFVAAHTISPDTPLSVLHGDAFDGRTDVIVVDDVRRLIDDVAPAMIAVLRPIFLGIRRLAPYGLAGLWGGVADQIGAVAIRTAHEFQLDADTSWRTAEALIDAIRRRVEEPVTAPSRELIDCGGRPINVSVKGTCCLLYKIAAADGEEAYCMRCPLLTAQARRERWIVWLSEGRAPR